MAADQKELERRSRFVRMRAHLDIRAAIDSPRFATDVAAACREQVDALLDGADPRCGEDVLEYLAQRLHVRFEEVHGERDIQRIEQKYLHDQREIGIGQLEMQLRDPGVDALLFEREGVDADAPDKWIAVLDLRDGTARGYFDRAHEISHRIAEPPQQNLRFYRHRNDRQNPLESLIDKVAGDIAFYPGLFGPIIGALSEQPLTWDIVEAVRNTYAAACSRLASVHAVLRAWPGRAYLLAAQVRGRRGQPHMDRALRIDVQGYSPAAQKEGILFFPNMRVPPSSPIWHTHHSAQPITAYEPLGQWSTKTGNKRLPSIEALTSATRYGDKILALVSF